MVSKGSIDPAGVFRITISLCLSSDYFSAQIDITYDIRYIRDDKIPKNRYS